MNNQSEGERMYPLNTADLPDAPSFPIRLFFAGGGLAAGLGLGGLLAMGLEEGKPNPWLDALVAAPMIIPDIVLAIALLSFYTLLNMSLGLHSIVLSHAVFNIAFVCVVVRTRLKNFDKSIVEASIDLGASEFTTFRRVTLPVIAPGVVAAYLMVRPALHALPAFKHFYDEADTFWGKAWAVCGKSATMLWSYLLSALAGVWTVLDPLAQLFGDPELKAQIIDALKDHPQWAGYFLMGVSAITIIARMRSIESRSCPRSRTLPASRRTSLSRTRRSVVFPAPFGPRSPCTCPRLAARSTSWRAERSRYRLAMPTASNAK